MPEQALKQTEGDTDYELNEEYQSCWITVNNISVYICKTDEGVVVDLFPLHRETDESIAGTWATFAEASEDRKRPWRSSAGRACTKRASSSSEDN